MILLWPASAHKHDMADLPVELFQQIHTTITVNQQSQRVEKKFHSHPPGTPGRRLWTGQQNRMFQKYMCVYTNKKWTLRNKVLMFTTDEDIHLGSYPTVVSTAHFKT